MCTPTSHRKRLRKHGHHKDHTYLSGGDLLDPIRDNSLSEHDEDVPEVGGGRRWGEMDDRRGMRPGGEFIRICEKKLLHFVA